MQNSIPLISYYHQEIKGLSLGLLLMPIAAVLNNYFSSASLLPPANTLWLYSLFFIAAIVIAMVLQMYHWVSLIKK
ncbi:hypothetical protein [Ferruginibacter sp.]|nr:hypothetical protein [Ferruginibacter sp.]